MLSGRTGQGRGRGGVTSKTLPYTSLRSPPSIPQPSSSTSTGQPQEPVEELSTRFHPSVQPVRVIIKLITSKFEEPHHVYSQVPEKINKLWFEEWAVNFKVMISIFFSLNASQSSSWFHPEIEQVIERRLARANEGLNATIKHLQENYRKEIDELKKLIISSRNQQEQDHDA
ncbi:uncharacterized protein G2W53_044448 [Senna tora]|uniref:Uncharacterized protein n=1 Tax=Senna tora TaxID=362788 RepID=A0A834VX32_9FABA|nr:uncharacterized protein G2W53_044448 [Senna tora]